MPDLNLENPEVTQAIDDVARTWLDDLPLDGYRLDAAKHLIEDGDQLENTPATHAWLADFRDDLHASHPEALVLGEVYDATIDLVGLRPRRLARPDVRLRARVGDDRLGSTRATRARSRPPSARSPRRTRATRSRRS